MWGPLAMAWGGSVGLFFCSLGTWKAACSPHPWYRSSSLSRVWSAGLAVPSPTPGPAHLVYCLASGRGDGCATSFLGSHLVSPLASQLFRVTRNQFEIV